MTTVGYEDLMPDSQLSKLLACIYVFTRMTLVGLILSKATDYIVEKQKIILVKTIFKGENIDPEQLSKEVETNKAKYKLILTTFIFLVLMIAGTIFLYFIENLDFVDAFYCVCSTITTFGYGNKSFSCWSCVCCVLDIEHHHLLGSVLFFVFGCPNAIKTIFLLLCILLLKTLVVLKKQGPSFK